MSDSSQYCTFYLEDYFFGIGVQLVQEVIRFQEMTPIPLAPEYIEGFINLRGQIVTAVDLRRRLGYPTRDDDKRPMNVIVNSQGEPISLLVDRIGDVLEVDQSLFEPPPDTLKGTTRDVVDGVYKLEGQLLLVLDINRVLKF
jgi:purine-binding chemotaxis protein CheW